MNSALNTHLVLLLMVFAQLPSSFTKGTIQVIGSSHPIVALVGDDVILPCYLNSSISASDKTVEWTKYKLDPRFVYVWRDGGELESKKNPSYKGRTTVSLHKLKLGDISLNLSKVRLSDRGRYRCFLPDMGETLMELIVGAVSLPVILRVQKAKTGVALQCESAGWYPEPELLWLDGEGNLLSAGPTETLRGPDDLYTVSSRVTVEKRHSNNITCRVQQRNTNQSRETHIHVPEDFFEVPSSSPSVIIGLAVSLALCIMLLISSAAVLLCRMKKHKNNRSPEDQTDVGGADVPLRGSSPKTKNKTSCWPLTWTSKLQEEQQRREEAEKNLQNIKEELQSEKKNTEIINKLQQEKQTVEDLKTQLEKKNCELENKLKDEKKSNGEKVKELQQEKKAAEDLKKELEEKNRELSGNISQAQEEKQKMESEMKRLRNELDSTNQQLEKKNTETINQLKQEKQAAEKLKNQFKSKCHEMINSEKEEIIQKLTETFPALDSKLQSEKITENIKQLQQVKDRVEKLKNQLEKNSHEILKSEMELDEFIQKVLQTFPTLESKGVKQAAENLKAELEFRSREMINSEKEKDGIIQKLMRTFSTLDSKWKKNNETIKQLDQVKQRAEGLKKQLQPQTHEWTEKTETIHQLQQLEQAAEILKIQLESKNQQMIKSDKIIQKLMKIFPALDSKWKENTEIINQLQEVKETAEKLKQLEKNNQLQGETDSEIIKQLQEVKDTAEKLKNQMESKNWEMLQAEKKRNDETDRKLKELVKQLEKEKTKTEKNLNELVKMLEDEKKKT